uniref:Heme peroxidase n=1 Tax=viral metagenome TaxID=1070528 RepID=A0A6C0KLZ6_9ZZZZ
MTRNFDRLLPPTSPVSPLLNELTSLANLMRDSELNRLVNIEKVNYAGLTYLGQFIDHDLTFESKTKFDPNIVNIVDVSTLKNERTSYFDLDSLFGGENNSLLNADGLFTIETLPDGGYDLPRGDSGLAIIGDQRNEENLIILQLNILFLQFYNKVFSDIKNKYHNLSLNELIKLSKRTVQHHYQHIVVNDYLKGITGNYFSRLFDVNGKPIIHPKIKSLNSALPLEFSGAAYRFGHSLVRNNYYLNSKFDVIPLFSQNGADLSGFRPRSPDFNIDWSMFFPLPGSKGFQEWSKFDPFIVDSLYNLPANVATGVKILPLRTLLRGTNVYGLSSGQELARSLGISENEILSSKKGNLMFQTEKGLPAQSELDMLNDVFGEQTPLFYYILMEAWVYTNGDSLGPLGSAVVGQVFLNLLENDQNSYLNTKFSPKAGEFGCIKTGDYDMTSLICYTLGIKYDITDTLPTPYTNFFDQHNNNQFSVAKGIGHPLQSSIQPLGNPDILVSKFPGYQIAQWDPTLVLGTATQQEIDLVASNALKFKKESVYAVVKYLCNKNIEAIATQVLIPLGKKIKRPITGANFIRPEDNKSPIKLTKSQLRGRAIVDSINDSLTKTITEATELYPLCKAEIEQALAGLIAPPSINPKMFLGNDFIIEHEVPVIPEKETNLNLPDKITNLVCLLIKRLNKLKKIKYEIEFMFE